MLKIGEFAALCGVSAKRLRHYDTLGLFRPAWTDPVSGYRYYSPAQLPELQRIIGLRVLGIGLDEVADLVRGGADLADALRRRRTQLEEERAALELRLAGIRVELDRDEFGDPLGVVIRPIAAERVASLATVVDPGEDLAPLFDEIEEHVRDSGARASRPPVLIEWERTTGQVRMEIAIPTTRRIPETDRIVNRVLEAVDAATLLHRGDYDGLGDARTRLSAWLAATGSRVAGPLRIVYLQFSGDTALRLPTPFLVEAVDQFVTELQQPIERPGSD